MNGCQKDMANQVPLAKVSADSRGLLECDPLPGAEDLGEGWASNRAAHRKDS